MEDRQRTDEAINSRLNEILGQMSAFVNAPQHTPDEARTLVGNAGGLFVILLQEHTKCLAISNKFIEEQQKRIEWLMECNSQILETMVLHDVPAAGTA
jgi:hypothetical protein